MTFISNPRRDASATIAGFVFQVNVTILAGSNCGRMSISNSSVARTSTPCKTVMAASLWRRVCSNRSRCGAVAALRGFLRVCTRPERVSTQVWQAMQQVLASDDDTQLSEIILAFEWGIGSGDYSQIEKQIVAALTSYGQGVTPDDASQVYEHLFAFVFRLLCQPPHPLEHIPTSARSSPCIWNCRKHRCELTYTIKNAPPNSNSGASLWI